GDGAGDQFGDFPGGQVVHGGLGSGDGAGAVCSTPGGVRGGSSVAGGSPQGQDQRSVDRSGCYSVISQSPADTVPPTRSRPPCRHGRSPPPKPPRKPGRTRTGPRP